MLFISGIKHSGKTTAARLIASSLKLPHVDNDALILEHFHQDDIRSFFKSEGKERFMEAEYEALLSYLDKNIDSVISLGGGACDNAPLLKLCKERGKLIYIARPENVLLPCILKHGVPPFLDSQDIEGSFHHLFIERDKKYRENANLIIELGPFKEKEETAREILAFLEAHNVR